MTNTIFRFLLINVLFALNSLSVFAQSNTTVLTFVDSTTKQPIPFVHTYTGPSQHLSDIDGNIRIKATNKSIQSIQPAYTNKRFKIPPEHPDTLVVLLTPTKTFGFINYTNYEDKQLISSVIAYRHVNEPENSRPMAYDTYNKFFISTDNLEETRGFVDKVLNYFKLSLKDFPENHHLILSESISHRNYLNPLHEKETVTASRVSGIDHPRLLNINSQIQPLSLYKPFIRIASHQFTNPITPNTFRRYHFQVIDTIAQGSDHLFVVKFNPKMSARFESVKGYLFINSDRFAIQHAIIEPAITRGLQTRLMQTSVQLEDGTWFPQKINTTLSLDNFTNKEISFEAHAISVIHNVTMDTTFHPNQFNDVTIDYATDSEIEDSLFWHSKRLLPFDSIDQSTYSFYDTLGSVSNFERILNIGEHLLSEEVAFTHFIIELNKLADLNDYEGLRLGVGGRTSSKLSDRLSLGAYAAYGTKDTEGKFGGNFWTSISPQLELESNIYAFNDVKESGHTTFIIDKPQYSTEWLRGLKVNLMDRIQRVGVDITLKPIDYTQLYFQVSRSTERPGYRYSYVDNTLRNFEFMEFTLGTRFAFGERYFKLLHKKIPLASKYPVFWFQVTKGFNGLLGGQYDFQKIDIKAEHTIPIVGWGKSIFQLIGGVATGQLPYSRLYVGEGSRGIKTVTHNNFETMDYNEFLSDQYIYLFYSHNFGFINFISRKNFRPSVEAGINLGIGSLKSPENHQNIHFKTLEKGFAEAGFLINDLFVVRPAGIKAGFGIGFYNRFGPNRLSSFTNNSVIKIATNFVI